MNYKKMFYEFNKIYGLPINKAPTLLDIHRLDNFKNILMEEVNEAEEIITKQSEAETAEQRLVVLAEIADWFGDIIWYVQSEAIKYGLYMDDILKIINNSNLSKLDENGKPIYDERGKVLRGANYHEPQPAIVEYLRQKSLNTSLVSR